MADREKSIAALQALTASREVRPDVPLARLVDEVARRHDLNAAESEWLLRMALASAPGAGGDPADCPTCGGALQEARDVAGHLVCGSGHLVTRRPPAPG